jgi:hypothetical protein
MTRQASAVGMDAAGTFSSLTRSAPETGALVALIGMAAAWATRVGVLPGWSHHFIGALLQGIFWACLYVGLAMPYRLAALQERRSVRSVLLRLSLCLLLALLSTYICKILLVPFLAPATWKEFFYLRLLLPPTFLGLWCSVLLARETRAVYRAAVSNQSLAPLPQLALLLACAAVLVSGADLVFQWRTASAANIRMHGDIVRMNAWATNLLLLFSAFAFVFAGTSKVAAAVLLISPLYLGLGLATLAKLEYMHSAVQPLDLLRVAEFVPLFQSFFGTGGLLATISAFGIWILALLSVRRFKPSRVPNRRRWSLGFVSLSILLVSLVAFAVAPSRPAVNALLLRLGTPDDQHREHARSGGFLLSFLSELPSVLVPTPHDYSPAAVASTLSRYQKEPGDLALGRRPRVNLIIYLVESLMDPDDLSWHYTADPIPNIRSLGNNHIRGYGIVPEEFGGSANTEFELLTGMTRSFLPEGSLPYRQYLRRPIPSLPRLLKELGYATIAIQADPKYYYDRERVYNLLAFQSSTWLRGTPGIKPGRYAAPEDDVVVKEIIQASQGSRPFFIFAFPSSTHAPYNTGVYKNSDLDVVDSASSEAKAVVKEYINALRDADRAIGTLSEYFRHRPDSTIIAIVGDHLPPLPKTALGPFFTNISSMSKPEGARRLHRVPLIVWANFDLLRAQEELSTNALPSFLLEKMGIPPSGFLAVTDAVRRKVPVVGKYVRGANGHIWDPDSLPDAERALLDDYRLLQYDLLLGKQYALRDSVPGWEPIRAP